MRIGIVGSRSFPQIKLVKWFINDLPKDCIIVSGGAAGVDKVAIEIAQQRGLATQEFYLICQIVSNVLNMSTLIMQETNR